MPDIFDEVAEDLRSDRNHALLRRYGGVALLALVLIVAGVGGWEVWRQAAHGRSDSEATQYLAAQTLADGAQNGRLDALPGFGKIADAAGPGYRTLARLREAALQADAGKLPDALGLWDKIAADGGADPILRDFANLQWALHQIDAGEPGLVSARLLPLTGDDSVWRPLAQEGQAMLAMRQGNTEAARDTLRRLAADNTAPDGVRGRANGLLQRLGG